MEDKDNFAFHFGAEASSGPPSASTPASAPIPGAGVPPAQAQAEGVGPALAMLGRSLASKLSVPQSGLQTLWTLVLTVWLCQVSGCHLGVPALDLNPVHWVRGGSTTSAPLHLTLVYDGDSEDPAKTAARLKADLAGSLDPLSALGCSYRAVDKDSSVVADEHLGPYAAELPALIVQADGDKAPRSHAVAPATAAEVLALVHKIRGK